MLDRPRDAPHEVRVVGPATVSRCALHTSDSSDVSKWALNRAESQVARPGVRPPGARNVAGAIETVSFCFEGIRSIGHRWTDAYLLFAAQNSES